MDKRANSKIETYLLKFKDDIRDKIISIGFEDKSKMGELVEFVYEYERLNLSRDDFSKQKRYKNDIPSNLRCIAKRANNEQCTRRRKTDSEFCGTHCKGTPNGSIQTTEQAKVTKKKIDVFAKDINGIMYFVDEENNVYKTEDVLSNKENPQVIAKCKVENDKYMIEQFLVI